MRAFALNDYSEQCPTGFEYEYIQDGVKYIYGFSATKKEIVKEYLYSAPKGQKAEIFSRNHQEFSFPSNGEKGKRK